MTESELNGAMPRGIGIAPYLRIKQEGMTENESRIVEWFLTPGNLSHISGIKEVAQSLGMSEAMIAKVSKILGFSCFRQLRGAIVEYFEHADHDITAELGHIPLGDVAARCGCGNPGCLETLCSGVALARWYAEAPRDYRWVALFSHARYEKSLMEFIELAAKAIATGINLFDPDYVLLGGGVMDMADFPYDRLVERTGVFTRKPLPFNALTFAKASSSTFNGAIGAARMGLDLPVKRRF